jgi:soluble lytic murein transglycosylase
MDRAEKALAQGDYAAAEMVYQGLPMEQLEETEAARARLARARSFLEDEDYGAAVQVFETFLRVHPDHPLTPDAYFMLAETLVQMGDYLAAIDAYRAYLAERDVIASYVYQWIGDAYSMAGSYDKASAAYGEALDEAPTPNMIFQLREKLGLAYGYAGDHEAALTEYDAILANAQDSNFRARIQYQAAQVLLVSGDREAAYRRLYDLVNNYYKTPSAYEALVDLINSDQLVNDYQRGLVDYYNGAYDAAISAFYRAIEADPQGHAGVLHYFAGLAYRAAGNYVAAVSEFETLIETHAGEAYVDDAWLAKAWTQYRMDADQEAVASYRLFVADHPESELVPEALWWAANIHFWKDEYEEAALLFEQLSADHPDSEYASDALYRAAFCRYRLEEYDQTPEMWGRYADVYSGAELSVGADFWRGRSYLSAAETVSATQAFSVAAKSGPLDYYSQRALDYLVDLEDPRPPFIRRPAVLDPAHYDEPLERAATDVWLADYLGLSDTEAITLSQLSPVLAVDPRLLRGKELWLLGRRAEAKEELESLRRDTATHLSDQYQLAIFFRDLGLYRSSILAANAAILLSPARSPFDAPAFLARLAYPIYYGELVQAEAEAKGLDPLLVMALIRQESLFEGFATSYAYAYGLMQIIPSTGQSIAQSLAWADYETDDLYRPFISVKFGTWYLAQQLERFDGLVYPALSAYNAGPGNARRWLDRTMASCDEVMSSQDCAFDYDVFVELVDLYEPRLYIRQIYKHFAVYQHLYAEGTTTSPVPSQ